MIRKILVPVRGDGKGNNVFAHAAALARRFNAHVVVTHCRPRPQDMLPYGVPLPKFLKDRLQAQATELGGQVADSLKQELLELAAQQRLEFSDTAIDGKATVAWVEESGRQVEIIKRHGRLADLVAVAQPESNGMLGVNSLKAALFHTGRPALMCPEADTVPETLGEHVAVAWNGSTEAARAVALNLGLLEGAKKITILSGGEETYGTKADDLAAYLGVRGLTCDIERFKATHNVGEELVSRSRRAGADLLIMGAYGDNHEKEIMFGGNTQSVVEESDLPTVLVH